MLSPNTPTTEYASPQRLSQEDIHVQADKFLQESFFRQVLDTIPMMVLVLNCDRQVVYANLAAVKRLGDGRPELLLGQRTGELLGCNHASEREEGCGTTRFCKDCGAVRGILTALHGKQAVEECRILAGSEGRTIALDLRVYSQPIEFNNEQFVIFSIEDIGNEKRRQALESIFFHDIQNTVGSISLALEVLTPHVGKLNQEPVAIARQGVKRLIQEIEAQRDIQAAESNKLQPRFSLASSKEILQNTIEICANHPVAQQKSIYLDESSSDISFFTDPVLLGRVLYNMLKNALEASQPGQLVRVGCYASGDYVEFTVNNQAFMAENIQRQVFSRSFSTKGKGRGLGTYSMRLLSENYLHGKIFFTSDRSNGTTFIARYPMNGK